MVSPLRVVRGKSLSRSDQARDEVGRWRKIYYRLRSSELSEGQARAALDVVSDAERAAASDAGDRAARIEGVRLALDELALSEGVDERVRSDAVASALAAADLMGRVEALGSGSSVSMNQLPQALQDVLKEFMGERDLEPRIVDHFGPFVAGESELAVADVLNFLDRIAVDGQGYGSGYDLERASLGG